MRSCSRDELMRDYLEVIGESGPSCPTNFHGGREQGEISHGGWLGSDLLSLILSRARSRSRVTVTFSMLADLVCSLQSGDSSGRPFLSSLCSRSCPHSSRPLSQRRPRPPPGASGWLRRIYPRLSQQPRGRQQHLSLPQNIHRRVHPQIRLRHDNPHPRLLDPRAGDRTPRQGHHRCRRCRSRSSRLDPQPDSTHSVGAHVPTTTVTSPRRVTVGRGVIHPCVRRCRSAPSSAVRHAAFLGFLPTLDRLASLYRPWSRS